MSKLTAQDMKEFRKLTGLTYMKQATYFMNAYWEEVAEKEAETIWGYEHQMEELDTKQKKQGSDLDEMQSHRFLEKMGETLTVKKLREKLKTIDYDKNRRMALLEYLIFKYNRTVKELLGRPQGDNTEFLAKAEKKMRAATNALSQVTQQLEEQKIALNNQRKAKKAAEIAEKAAHEAKDSAKQAQANAEKAERSSQRAAKELQEALDTLHAREKAFNDKCKKYEDRGNDMNLGVVKRNRAKAELAQLKCTDPLPLRKAKITQAAAVKKAEKRRKQSKRAADKARAATDKATKAATAAVAATERAVNAEREAEVLAKKLEASVEVANQKVQAARDFLEDAKKHSGKTLGSIWWMERELEEAQKYLPQSKQRKFKKKRKATQ